MLHIILYFTYLYLKKKVEFKLSVMKYVIKFINLNRKLYAIPRIVLRAVRFSLLLR